MSTNPGPGIDQHPMSTGFVTLTHLLQIFNMFGVRLPANSTDLGISEIFLAKHFQDENISDLGIISSLEFPKVLVKYT